MQFPKNPEQLPPKIRKGLRDGYEFADLIEELDRMRRNYEYMVGSIDQEDASVSGKVSIPSGNTATITITPESGRNQYLSEVGVNPSDPDLNISIDADGQVSTDSNSLFFKKPFTLRRRVKITVENTKASEQEVNYFTEARSVKQRGEA